MITIYYTVGYNVMSWSHGTLPQVCRADVGIINQKNGRDPKELTCYHPIGLTSCVGGIYGLICKPTTQVMPGAQWISITIDEIDMGVKF